MPIHVCQLRLVMYLWSAIVTLPLAESCFFVRTQCETNSPNTDWVHCHHGHTVDPGTVLWDSLSCHDTIGNCCETTGYCWTLLDIIITLPLVEQGSFS